MTNPYEQYKKIAVNTMTKGELLVLLFDEAIKKLNQSIILMEHGDYDNSKINLEKTRKIFNHLIVTLDDKYQISQELVDMYMFFNTEIVKASLLKSTKHIEDILPIIKELRDTWVEADKLTKTNKS